MSDHATTLRELAADMASNLATYPKGSEGVPALAREMAQIDSERAACLAGADALRRGTCANCDHRIDWPDAIGCNNARGLGRDEVSPDDFCSEWAPRKDAPTEPTR